MSRTSPPQRELLARATSLRWRSELEGKHREHILASRIANCEHLRAMLTRVVGLSPSFFFAPSFLAVKDAEPKLSRQKVFIETNPVVSHLESLLADSQTSKYELQVKIETFLKDTWYQLILQEQKVVGFKLLNRFSERL